MKVKDVILSYGPTIKVGEIYFKANVSMRLEDFTEEDMPEAQKLLRTMYLKTLGAEMKLGNALNNKTLEQAADLIAKRLNKIDGSK